jgi:hypothetical protein
MDAMKKSAAAGSAANSRAPISGDVHAIPLQDDWYAACRILEVRGGGAAVLVANVDWIARGMPELGDARMQRVLRLTHGAWNGKPSVVWVEGGPPKEFVPLGNIGIEVAIEDDDVWDVAAFGGWQFFQVQPLLQLHSDHPELVPSPGPPPEGRIVLHRFNGDEVFQFANATISAFEDYDGPTVYLELDGNPDGAQRCADTSEQDNSAGALVYIRVPDLDLDLDPELESLVGREFSIDAGEDHVGDLPLLSYFEYEPLRRNRIRFLSRNAGRFRIEWTGETCDVNHYDGSKPPTQVEISGDFILRP